jgi:hypothetical protein
MMACVRGADAVLGVLCLAIAHDHYALLCAYHEPGRTAYLRVLEGNTPKQTLAL